MDERWIRILEAAIEYEGKRPGDELGWEWHDVRAHPSILKAMVIEGLIDVSYSSSSSTHYRLHDINEAKRIVREYRTAGAVREAVEPVREITPPDDLFDSIVGWEDIKPLLLKSIKKERVHFLFIGPPASAKTLFLLELGRLPDSFYALGGSSTKAGLIEQLFGQKPRFLLIDELEKMAGDDFTCLLSLMETGIVKEVKSGKQREMLLTTNVYAACNTIKHLPPELLDRFQFTFTLPTYTKKEFENVIMRHLTAREGIEEMIAKEIASKLHSLDVRCAIGIARMCDTVEEVNDVINVLSRYGGV